MIPQLATMSEQQRALFYAEMGAYGKDEVAGVLLALFLGTFGAHHFYLGRTGLGVLYLLFSWTGIPSVVGFVECFLMPGRVRRYNLDQALLVAAKVRGASPSSLASGTVTYCPACGAVVALGLRFCARCGAAAA